MIIIRLNFKQVPQDGFVYDELMIGHGFPTYGQMSFISYTRVYQDLDGNVGMAESIWSL